MSEVKIVVCSLIVLWSREAEQSRDNGGLEQPIAN